MILTKSLKIIHYDYSCGLKLHVRLKTEQGIKQFPFSQSVLGPGTMCLQLDFNSLYSLFRTCVGLEQTWFAILNMLLLQATL